MGLLDQVIGGLMSNAGGGGSPIQGVLMNLLSGNQQGASGAGAGYNQTYAQGYPAAGNTGGMAGPGVAGGLAMLVSGFQQAGLGHIVQSWISDGPNHPVSPQQLQTVLGENQVQSMASQSGMAPQDFLSQLSQHLPTAVDRLTPNGRVPDEGTVSV